MSSFSVCAENVLIQDFFESDRLNSKYLFWNDMPPKPALNHLIQRWFFVLQNLNSLSLYPNFTPAGIVSACLRKDPRLYFMFLQKTRSFFGDRFARAV